MSFRSPSDDGLSTSPNAAGDANNPAASIQELQNHRFWGRYATPSDLPNTAGNPASNPSYNNMAPGDVAYSQSDACLYLLTDRGTLSAVTPATWVCLTSTQTIRDAHVLVVSQEGYLPVASGVANFANLPNPGPFGGTGITADITDPGDGTGLAQALSVAAALGATKTGVDVRLRPCALTIDVGAITGLGFGYPLVVGAPTAPVSLEGPNGGERNVLAMITGPTGVGGTTQRVFNLEPNSHLKNLSITSPLADATAVGGNPGKGIINLQAPGSTDGFQSIRNCKINILTGGPNVRPSAVGIWAYDTGSGIVPGGVVIEDCDIRAGNIWPETVLFEQSEPIRLGNAGSVSGNLPYFGSQRVAVRRCYLEGNFGVRAFNLYGMVVEDVQVRQTEDGSDTTAGVFPAISWLLETDPTGFLPAGTILELPRITNLLYDVSLNGTPGAVHSYLGVLIQTGVTTILNDYTLGQGLHVDDVRCNYFCSQDLNHLRSAVNIDLNGGLNGPGLRIEHCQVTNITCNQGGAMPTGTITAVPGASLVNGDFFIIDDGIHAPVTFEFAPLGNPSNPDFVGIPFLAGDTVETVCLNIVSAILNRVSPNGVKPLSVWAFFNGPLPGGNTVTVQHDVCGALGNQAMTDGVAAPAFVVAGLSGGFSQYEYGIRLRARLTSGGEDVAGTLLRDVRIADCNFPCPKVAAVSLEARENVATINRIQDVDIQNVYGRGAATTGILIDDTAGGAGGGKGLIEDTIILGCHLKDTPTPITDNGVGSEKAHNILA